MLLLDFIAESTYYPTIRPGEKVYIINDTNSKDWTLVEKVDEPGSEGISSETIYSIS